jgi:hypothetical protein
MEPETTRTPGTSTDGDPLSDASDASLRALLDGPGNAPAAAVVSGRT